MTIRKKGDRLFFLNKQTVSFGNVFGQSHPELWCSVFRANDLTRYKGMSVCTNVILGLMQQQQHTSISKKIVNLKSNTYLRKENLQSFAVWDELDEANLNLFGCVILHCLHFERRWVFQHFSSLDIWKQNYILLFSSAFCLLIQL